MQRSSWVLWVRGLCLFCEWAERFIFVLQSPSCGTLGQNAGCSKRKFVKVKRRKTVNFIYINVLKTVESSFLLHFSVVLQTYVVHAQQISLVTHLPWNSKAATALLQLCSTNCVVKHLIAMRAGKVVHLTWQPRYDSRLLMRSVWLWHCMTSAHKAARIHHNKPMDIRNRIGLFGVLSMAIVAGTSSPYFDDCL